MDLVDRESAIVSMRAEALAAYYILALDYGRK